MPPPNLIYTIAFDSPGSTGQRALAKMLASSLLKTYFTGDIIVFRNTEAPLFLVERKGLEEVYIDTPEMNGPGAVEFAMRWKYQAASRINSTCYNKVMFLDSDCLALRNIDHLFEGDWDIAFKTERGLGINHSQFSSFLTDEEMADLKCDGVNSGTWAVNGSLYQEVMRQWEALDSSPPVRQPHWSDQPAWNRLLLDTSLKTAPFPEGEIQFPLYQDARFPQYSKAALTHNLGGTLEEKVNFTFGLYMQNFYCDPSALFLQFLEV